MPRMELSNPLHFLFNLGAVTTISVGCASLVPHRDDTILALIQAADSALYDAMHQGKNRVVVQAPLNAPPTDPNGGLSD